MRGAVGTSTLHHIATVCVAIGLVAPLPAVCESSPWDQAAELAGIPKPVLYAMAMCESARAHDRVAAPWPWTLRWSGGAAYLESEEAAAGAFDELLAAGFRNIDVGLMQVNWRYHAARLAGGEPARLLAADVNLRIAATILREALEASRGDVVLAVARYHSGDRERGARYAAHVLALASLLEREGRLP